MERGQKLRTKVHELEKRLIDLEKEFGGLVQKSLVLGAVLDLLVDRGLILHGQLRHPFNRALEPSRERIGQYAEAELQKFVYSLLDNEMESLDEAEMPHA